VIKFKFEGIEIEVFKRPEPYEYEIAENKTRIGYNKTSCVIVDFWDFRLKDGDLFELSLVKSVCTYFMQAYWKRSTKQGQKILLRESLTHKFNGDEYETSTLNFEAMQRDKINTLRIQQKNDDEIAGEIYLSGRQVIQLDVAIGRAISLMSPDTYRD
jgi:hypothetical protein